MCLAVKQKFESNDNSVICYKIVRVWHDKMFTPFRDLKIEDGFLIADSEPYYSLRSLNSIDQRLSSGAIHCFVSRNDARNTIYDCFYEPQLYEIWKVMGHNLIARGGFDFEWGAESLAFERVEFLEKVEF